MDSQKPKKKKRLQNNNERKPLTTKGKTKETKKKYKINCKTRFKMAINTY